MKRVVLRVFPFYVPMMRVDGLWATLWWYQTAGGDVKYAAIDYVRPGIERGL